MARLTGQVAIVTGAARGLGAAAAKALCEDGAAVLLTDVLVSGEETAEALRRSGHRTAFVRHDVREEAGWKMVVGAAAAAFGDVTILVNNAGVARTMTFEEATIADYQLMIDIMMFGPLLGMQAVLPAMKRAGGGSIINISSNSTRKVLALTSCYGSVKAGLANLSKTAAVHCAQSGYNIRVNTVHPGPHATAMLLGEDMLHQAAAIAQVKAGVDSIPMKRLGEPSEVAKVVAFLASADASYVTGAEIFVDGGLSVT